VFQEKQIDRKTQKIHHTRLMPRRNKSTQRQEVSVCRSSTLTESQVWEICSVHFDSHAPKRAIGRGVGPASVVTSVGLGFDADGRPYPEHANIVGWFDIPNKPSQELKHFWMDQAQRMAKDFQFASRP
jgi:hypothetical protein